MTDTNKQPSKGGVEGEGSYSGTRDYNAHTDRFIKQGKVDKAAKEARRALENAEEAAELEKAKGRGKAGEIHDKTLKRES